MNRITILFIAAIVSLRCSTTDTKRANPDLTASRVDLSNKTFAVAIDADLSGEVKAGEISMLFQDTTGVFRLKKGAALYQRPFTWQFIDDSLSIQYPKDSVDYGESKQQFTPVPVRYAVVKEPGGYMLTGKTEKILLTETK